MLTDVVDEVEFFYTVACRRCSREGGGAACEDSESGWVDYVLPPGWTSVGVAALDGVARDPRMHRLHFCPTCSEDEDGVALALVDAVRDLRGLGRLRQRPPREPDAEVDGGEPPPERSAA